MFVSMPSAIQKFISEILGYRENEKTLRRTNKTLRNLCVLKPKQPHYKIIYTAFSARLCYDGDIYSIWKKGQKQCIRYKHPIHKSYKVSIINHKYTYTEFGLIWLDHIKQQVGNAGKYKYHELLIKYKLNPLSNISIEDKSILDEEIRIRNYDKPYRSVMVNIVTLIFKEISGFPIYEKILQFSPDRNMYMTNMKMNTLELVYFFTLNSDR